MNEFEYSVVLFWLIVMLLLLSYTNNRDQWICSCYWNWSQSRPRSHVHSSWRHQCSTASKLETLV